MSDDSWPSIRDELSRKMLGQLELVIERFKAKEIGLLELKRTIGVIYDTGSGIANEPDLDLIAAYYNKVEKACERNIQ